MQLSSSQGDRVALCVPHGSQNKVEMWQKHLARLSWHCSSLSTPSFLPFIPSCFSFAVLGECLMNPGLANRLNPPLRKQALAFIFLCGFGFTNIKVTLAQFVWISMKTSNPLLCNIPYFNNLNNYCFPFLIKSLETEPWRGTKQWRLLLWRMGRNICPAESVFRAGYEALGF